MSFSAVTLHLFTEKKAIMSVLMCMESDELGEIAVCKGSWDVIDCMMFKAVSLSGHV